MMKGNPVLSTENLADMDEEEFTKKLSESGIKKFGTKRIGYGENSGKESELKKSTSATSKGKKKR